MNIFGLKNFCILIVMYCLITVEAYGDLGCAPPAAGTTAAIDDALEQARLVDSQWGQIPQVLKTQLDSIFANKIDEDLTLRSLVDPGKVRSPKYYSVDKPFPRVGETDPVRRLQFYDKYVDYDALSDEAKYVGKNEPLYFGKAMKYWGDETDETVVMESIWRKTRGQVMKMFESGRSKNPNSDPAPHSDVYAHQVTTKDQPSMFIQTTKNYPLAQRYGTDGALSDADKGRMGIVYVIDPNDAELFDIEKALPEIGYSDSFNEQEVLLFESLAADRIIGAVIYQRPDGGGQMQPIGFLRNPNWVSRYPE